MKLRLLYLYRNLTRNPLRTALTCASVAFPIMIYVLSMAVVDGVQRFLDNSARQLRLAVTQKTSIANPLPAGHRARMESLDPSRTRLVAVCAMRWIGGQRENDPVPLSTIAVDADTFVAAFPEQNLTPDEIAAWQRDKQALIVGRSTAAQLGWKAGDRVSLRPSVPPYIPLEFHIISTAEKAEDNITNFFRRDYLEDVLREAGMPEGVVTFFFVKCGSQADLHHFRTKIDELFAGSPDETKTQDEKTFMNEFITQQFDLPRNLTILSALTVFVATMAAANTMSMNFRDRIGELATLKSLGFGGRYAFGLIQAEGLALCAVGGLIGAAGPYVAFTHTALRNVSLPIIQSLEIHPVTCVRALLIALAIGALAAAWPSWAAARMRVVTALRSLE